VTVDQLIEELKKYPPDLPVFAFENIRHHPNLDLIDETIYKVDILKEPFERVILLF
jgi:hypothetical protein